MLGKHSSLSKIVDDLRARKVSLSFALCSKFDHSKDVFAFTD